jgi:hypothetical protein
MAVMAVAWRRGCGSSSDGGSDTSADRRTNGSDHACRKPAARYWRGSAVERILLDYVHGSFYKKPIK